LSSSDWLAGLRAAATACGWVEERASSVDVVFVNRDVRVRVVLLEGGRFGGAWRSVEGVERSSFTTMPELLERWLFAAAQLTLFP
jgi:hypothetical protein